jgi:predicted XRE-type DNA-binding protein
MIKKIVIKLLKSGLTQTEISRLTNVPQPHISDIANGKRSAIMYEAGKRLEKLAETLPKRK